MKRSAKMLLMNSGKEKGRHFGFEYDDWRAKDHYPDGMEDKYRDHRGREHYEGGRYAPMRSESNLWVDDRYRDDRGREHYDGGRYAPMRGGYDDRMDMYYRPYTPPVYHAMNKIGFSMGDETGHRYPQEFDDYRMDEVAYRHGSDRTRGYSMSSSHAPLTKAAAIEWVNQMQNEDGTRGRHWTMEQTEEIRKKHGIDATPADFYATMNMLYSDYGAVIKKYANNVDFYAELAGAFINDKDAVPDKVAAYCEYIVKH